MNGHGWHYTPCRGGGGGAAWAAVLALMVAAGLHEQLGRAWRAAGHDLAIAARVAVVCAGAATLGAAVFGIARVVARHRAVAAQRRELVARWRAELAQPGPRVVAGEVLAREQVRRSFSG